MKLVTVENKWRIYELEAKECKEFGREYPTYITWQYEEDIGNMYLSENESSSLEDMLSWCKGVVHND